MKSKHNKMTVTYIRGKNGSLKLNGDEPAVLECIYAFQAGLVIKTGSLNDMLDIRFCADHVLAKKGETATVPRPLAAALIARNVATLAK